VFLLGSGTFQVVGMISGVEMKLTLRRGGPVDHK
jgi:hypothetical protein